jgi:hypothetical protein
MEKTFLNKRNVDFTKKAADLIAEGWTQKEKLQERLNAKNLRKHIRNATVKARLPSNASRLSSANLERMYANVDSMLNAEYARTKDSYAPFFRLYNGNTKKNRKNKSKSKSKNNNVTMNVKNNTAEFATVQNVAAMHNYIQRNPHLMNNAQRRKYEKEKHAFAVNELVELTSTMQVKQADQVNNSATASAAATPFARIPNTVNKPLPPLVTEFQTLQNFMPKNESIYEYSKSKKRLINTRKYPFRPKKSNLSVKSLATTLPAAAATTLPAAAVPLRLAMNNNNNNRNSNRNRNNNNNSNNNTQKSKRQKTNFRFANWK